VANIDPSPQVSLKMFVFALTPDPIKQKFCGFYIIEYHLMSQKKSAPFQ